MVHGQQSRKVDELVYELTSKHGRRKAGMQVEMQFTNTTYHRVGGRACKLAGRRARRWESGSAGSGVEGGNTVLASRLMGKETNMKVG